MSDLRTDLEPAVIRVVRRVTPDAAVGVTLGSALVEDLAFQSLAVAELGFALADVFDVSVTPEDAFGLATVSDVLDLVSARVRAGEGREPSGDDLTEWEAGYLDDDMEYP